jgi:hypothetical protein
MADGPEGRITLERRLASVGALLAYESTQLEILAALLLEQAEAGKLSEIAEAVPEELESLLEECISLRAVPTLPSGKLPKYYMEMAAAASQSARRVCAALLLAGRHHGSPHPRDAMLANALATGDDDPLVADVVGEGHSGRDAA